MRTVSLRLFDGLQGDHIYQLASGDIVTLKNVANDVHAAYPYIPYPAPNHNFPIRKFENEKWDRYGFALYNPLNSIVAEVFPEVDLRKCVGGEELIDRHGYHIIYLGVNEASRFPHVVLYPDGSLRNRCDNGCVYDNKQLITDHDIVDVRDVLPHNIMTVPEPKII